MVNDVRQTQSFVIIPRKIIVNMSSRTLDMISNLKLVIAISLN